MGIRGKMLLCVNKLRRACNTQNTLSFMCQSQAVSFSRFIGFVSAQRRAIKEWDSNETAACLDDMFVCVCGSNRKKSIRFARGKRFFFLSAYTKCDKWKFLFSSQSVSIRIKAVPHCWTMIVICCCSFLLYRLFSAQNDFYQLKKMFIPFH